MLYVVAAVGRFLDNMSSFDEDRAQTILENVEAERNKGETDELPRDANPAVIRNHSRTRTVLDKSFKNTARAKSSRTRFKTYIHGFEI